MEQLVRERFRSRYREGADIDGVRLIAPANTTFFKWDFYDLKNEGAKAFEAASRERKANQQRSSR